VAVHWAPPSHCSPELRTPFPQIAKKKSVQKFYLPEVENKNLGEFQIPVVDFATRTKNKIPILTKLISDYSANSKKKTPYLYNQGWWQSRARTRGHKHN
jgi:hypothetical protein